MQALVRIKVLIVGGSHDSIELIKFLRQYNTEIICCDTNSNCEASIISDKFVNISIFDFNAVLQVAKIEQVAYALTRCSGIPAMNCYQINQHLTSNTHDKTARRLLDKYLLSKFCKNLQIKYPQTLLANQKIITGNLSNKWIIKPLFEKTGKITTFELNNSVPVNKRLEYYQRCLDNSQVGQAILQHYCNGLDYSLLGYVSNKNYTAYCLLEEKNHFVDWSLNHNGFSVSLQNITPFLQIAQILAKTVAIPITPLNLSFRVNKDSITLLECNLDFGGEDILESFARDQSDKPMALFLNKLFSILQVGEA